MRKLKLWPISLFILIASCSSMSRTPDLVPGASIVRLGKSDPSLNCEEVGVVDSHSGITWSGHSEQGERNLLKNRAFKLGANYVRLETSGNYLSGTAFKCPSK